MNGILGIVSDFLANLESREKRAVKIGAFVAVVSISIMLVLPRWETYSQVKSQRDDLKTDVIWIQEKRDLVENLVNNCPSIQHQKDDFKADVAHLASRNQLKIVSTKQKENFISMTLVSSKSNQLLRFMHQISCRGYILGELKFVTNADDSSNITATLEVERVN